MTTIPASTATAFDRAFDDSRDGRHRRTPSYAIRLELVVEAPSSVDALLDVLAHLDPAHRVVELVVDDAIVEQALTR